MFVLLICVNVLVWVSCQLHAGRDAWLQNAWSELTPFSQDFSWTMDVVQSWFDELKLKALFQQHLPLLWEGEFLVATDSSACNPQDADCRQAA